MVKLQKPSRKRRMATTTVAMTMIASPLLGTSIGLSLFLPTACSFSVRSNLHPYHQPQKTHSTVASDPLGFSSANILPGGEFTSPHAATTIFSTRLGYLDYDMDTGAWGNLDEEKTFDIVPGDTNTQRRRNKTSREQTQRWGGLNELCSYSSPTSFPLGFSCFVPNGVSASLFSTTRNGIPDPSSPLVLAPSSIPSSSSEFLRSFLGKNEQWVQERILEHGAVVFRGFADLPLDREATAVGKEILRAFGSKSSNPNKGPRPLSCAAARKGFQFYRISVTRSKIAPQFPVERHVEAHSSQQGSSSTPRLVEIDARTGLTDWRGIYDDLPPRLRSKLEDKQLSYQRTDLVPDTMAPKTLLTLHGRDSRTSRTDTTQMDSTFATFADNHGTNASPYFQLYGSTDKNLFGKTYQKLVEQAGILKEKSGTAFVCDAFRSHPHTGEKIWFELAHRFHWTSLSSELWADFSRTKNLLTLVRATRATSVALWKRLRYWRKNNSNPPRSLMASSQRGEKEQQLGATTSVTFGDGTPISWMEMSQIRKAIKRNTAQYPWRPGDLLVVDGLIMGLQ